MSINRLKSILELDFEGNLKEDIEHFSKLAKLHFNHLIRKNTKSEEKERTENISNQNIIQRNYIGPLPFKRLMNPSRSESNQLRLGPLTQKYWGGIALELLNLANGKMNVEDIFLLLKIPYPDVMFDDIKFIVNLFIEEKILLPVEN